MFSPEIVTSEEFLSMPVSSRELYFQLGMAADDDGFVQPKSIMRLTGANDDDLKILLAKRFLLPFESGVVVIKHWLIHNMIRTDRYKPTRFQDEKNTLFIKENKAYTDRKPLGCHFGNQMAPQVRLGKVRLGKVINTLMSASADAFEQFWKHYPKKELKKKSQNIWKLKKLDSALPDILAFIEKAKLTDRWKKGFIKQPPTFLRNEAWNDDLTAYNDQNQSPNFKQY